MLHEILKILFPSPCLNCGYLGEALCDRCFHQIKPAPHKRDIFGMQVFSSMYYQNASILEKLLYPFKYKHQAEIFRVFVPYMVEALKLMGNFERIQNLLFVPVPLHKKRRLERGYNQAEILAKGIAKELGCETSSPLLRQKNTDSQAKITSAAERRKNMRDAFTVKSEISKNVQIVLVDDIVTTGSTLLACREALRLKGVEKIIALTLADREKTPQNPRD